MKKLLFLVVAGLVLLVLPQNCRGSSNQVYNFLRFKLFRGYVTYRSDVVRVLSAREGNMSTFHEFNYNRYGVDRRPYSTLSPAEFTRVYDNIWPVLVTGLIETLPIHTLNRFSSQFLVRNYGNEFASVTRSLDGKFSSREAARMSVSDFQKLILSFSTSENQKQKSWAYLSDELFIAEHDRLAELLPRVFPFSKPDLFDDAFQYPLKPPSAFLLWGSAGSRSSMHVDPCNWTGISWLLSGRKRWRLVAPSDVPIELTAVVPLKKVFPLPCRQYSSPYDSFSPSGAEQWQQRGVEFVQDAGDILVIPPGWFHQAFNVEESIAVSTSVMNSANYREILLEMARVGSFSKIPNLLKSLANRQPSPPLAFIVKQLLKTVDRNVLNEAHIAWQSLRAV